MVNIAIDISTSQLKSHEMGRGLTFLYYLKIAIDSRGRGGWFNASHFLSVTGLSERRGITHLKRLVGVGLIKERNTKRGRSYSIVSQGRYIGNGRRNYFRMEESLVSGFSWRNISEFRSYLSEVEVARYKRHQRASIKGYSYVDQRSGERVRVRKPELSGRADQMALSLAGSLVGFSGSTIGRNRKKQNLAVYKWEKRIISVKDVEFDENCRPFVKDVGGFCLFRVGADYNSVWYSPISTRVVLNRQALSFRRR